MTTLLILGAGGHAKVVADTALATGIASKIAFLDDRWSTLRPLPPLMGWPVIGPLTLSLEAASLDLFDAAVVAIGHSETRLHWIQQLDQFGYRLPSLIHPTAWVSSSSQLGLGSQVFAQVAVQANSFVGTGTILNTSCSIDHDVQLADGVHICPGAHLAGHVVVGSRSWIGIGSSIIQNISIGSDVIVGAGAAVVRDLPNGVTAVGVPARVVSSS